MSQLPSLKTLLIEDNPSDVLLLRTALEADQFSVFELTTVETLADGLHQIQQTVFDIVLVDLGLPDSAGLQTFGRIHQANLALPVVVFSGNEDEQEAIDAVRNGAQDYLVKSLSGFEIAARTIRYAIERHKGQQAMRESETRFSTTFFTSPVSQSIISSTNGKIVEVNDACCRLYEYSREELIGTDPGTLDLWANPADQLDVLEELQRNGRLLPREIVIRPKSGEIRTILFSVEQIVWKGDPCLISSSVDITERKRAEENLRLSELALRAAQSIARVGSWQWNLNSGEIIWSDEMFHIFGIDKNSYTGRLGDVIAKVIHPDDLHIVLPTNAATIANEPVEYRIILPDTSIRHIWAKSGKTILDSAGKPMILTGIAQDITERKQAEQALLQANERLSLAQHTAGAGVWDWDMKTGKLNWTSEFFHLFGLDPDKHEATFDTWRNALHPDDIQMAEQRIKDAIRNHQPLYNEYRIVMPSAETHWIGAWGDTSYDEHDEATRMTGVCIDITERKQAEAEIHQLNAELEKRVKDRTIELLRVNTELELANRTKDEFLANMSHELRTPLTGILGFTEAMQQGTYGQPSEKQIKALQNIEATGRHLLALINDILDLSKIEAGRFDIYPELISVEDTCRASLIFIKGQAQKKSLQLGYQLEKNVRSVFADPRRLKQILVNLLSNAVKFTPEKGIVTLTVRNDPEKGQIHFSVADNGIGIAKEDLDHLFSPFTQVDGRLNRKYEGTGLGLVLVLRLAEMHGGNVQVETELGRGSCFTVSLPWQSQVSTPMDTHQPYIEAPAEPAPNSQGVVLLAEDNSSNIEAIGDYIQFRGYTLVIASNGVEALIKAEESNPNLILMDIQMPVMDGLETIRRLRADPRFTATPIIALTALTMSGDRERCIEAGATDYLSKPVRLKELTEKIAKLLQP